MHTKQLIIVIFTWCWVTFVNAQQIQYISYPLSEEHLVPALTCESATLPTVTTGSASDVKGTSATCGGSIVSDGGAIITECGVCYSTTANPTIDNDKVVATGTTIGLFTCQLAGLTLNTTYYVRAYAVSNKGVSYGEAVQIHTDECDAKPDSLTFTVNNVSFKMILVEGGTFTMGSSTSGALHCEKPLHQVALSDYYMGETEVGKNLWTVVMETGDQLEKYNYPLTLSIGVNQNDSTVFKAMVNGLNRMYAECQSFVDKLNTLLASQLQGMRFAIPTEAQWEYAARGGKKGNGYTYSGSNTLATVGWYGDNSSGMPSKVKTRQPNELGIYDMSGNVWELCSDWVGTYSSATQINPAGLESGLWRVLRGGCWSESASECGVARRLPLDTYLLMRYGDYGLRLALLPVSDKCSSTTLPTVTTDCPDMDAPIQIRGKVLSDGGADIIERGICYSTADNPTIADTKVVASGTAIGQFICSVTPLQDSTTYYARAYATNSAGTSYGEVVFFTTKRKAGESGTEQGHEYVDLGLPSGLKWATCNVGASQPEAYGGFYAWGETSTKEYYEWETYKYRENNNITKYFKTGSAETSPTLEKTDDVASQLWGGSWHMPTAADWQELIDNCIWKLEFRNGVYGYRVSSKVYGNTNSIFLPALGRIVDGANIEEGCGGVYWSSTLHENYSDNAKLFKFSLRGMNLGYSERYFGEGVRAVCTGTTKNPEWVDLGLAVMWGTCNVGANTPDEVGNYYAWGETSPKDDYTWETYTMCKNGNASQITKYSSKNEESSTGIADYNYMLDPEDDVATVTKGQGWRMPTQYEWLELSEYCTYEWIHMGNDSGYLCTSSANNNTIFLPATGLIDNQGKRMQDHGMYWSSSLYTGTSFMAYHAYFENERRHMRIGNSSGARDIGMPIRAVYDPPADADHPDSITFTVEDVAFTMILVKGCGFSMGATGEQGLDAPSDEKPSHVSYVSSYYIGQTEVVSNLKNIVMKNGNASDNNNYPATFSSFDECQRFVNALNQQLAGQMHGMHFALPTEAQWEFAARGGKYNPKYTKYSGSDDINNIAWYSNNSSGKMHSVKGKSPNQLGLFDMSGNVWEVCSDWYADSYTKAWSVSINPPGATSGTYHVLRGGSWANAASDCRVSRRVKYSTVTGGVGLRLVLVP